MGNLHYWDYKTSYDVIYLFFVSHTFSKDLKKVEMNEHMVKVSKNGMFPTHHMCCWLSLCLCYCWKENPRNGDDSSQQKRAKDDLRAVNMLQGKTWSFRLLIPNMLIQPALGKSLGGGRGRVGGEKRKKKRRILKHGDSKISPMKSCGNYSQGALYTATFYVTPLIRNNSVGYF